MDDLLVEDIVIFKHIPTTNLFSFVALVSDQLQMRYRLLNLIEFYVTTADCPVGIMFVGLPDDIHHELERNVQVKLARCFEKWNTNRRNGGKDRHGRYLVSVMASHYRT